MGFPYFEIILNGVAEAVMQNIFLLSKALRLRENGTRMLRAILNKSWKHPIK